MLTQQPPRIILNDRELHTSQKDRQQYDLQSLSFALEAGNTLNISYVLVKFVLVAMHILIPDVLRL